MAFAVDGQDVRGSSGSSRVNALPRHTVPGITEGVNATAVQLVSLDTEINSSASKDKESASLSEYETGFWKTEAHAASSVDRTGRVWLQGSLREACGLVWVSQMAKQPNSMEGKSKKEEICGLKTKQ